MDKKRRLHLVGLVASVVTSLVPAQQTMQINTLLGPTIQEFGYQSLAEILNDLDNLQVATDPTVVETGKWLRLPNQKDLTGQEYYLVSLKKGEVYFVVSGFGRAIYQAFGPLPVAIPNKK